MPELPEVETIRRELSRRIVNQTIHDCTIMRKDVVGHPGPRLFCKALHHETIVSVARRAKYLMLELTHGKRLIFHLRLSGTIALRHVAAQPERFTRLTLTLDTCKLFFNEPRVLGRAYLIRNSEAVLEPKGLFTLGREPVSQDFDFAYFRPLIKNRKAYIKSLLLDQRICAGVGNIYSDEALFHAGIRPLRRAHRITRQETLKLLFSLKDILNRAVKSFGTSVGDYIRTDGRDGGFQNFLYVYGREHQPCRKCGATIVVTKIGNRSTRYCPKCQR